MLLLTWPVTVLLALLPWTVSSRARAAPRPPLHISVEGWRGIPHSYSVVNQFQLLELLKRDDVTVTVADQRYYKPAWRRLEGLFSEDEEKALAGIRNTSAADSPDVVLRMNYPLNLKAAPAGASGKVPATWVFGTTEIKTCIPAMRSTRKPEWRDVAVNMFTPSQWSRSGFLRSGLPDSRMTVIPHGVDTAIYRPLGAEDRSALRRRFGWEGRFVFLSIGAMTATKGVADLVECFEKLVEEGAGEAAGGGAGAGVGTGAGVGEGAGAAGRSWARQPMLVLKGHDMLYNSTDMLGERIIRLNQTGMVHYTGASLSFRQVAELYQAADAYVSPYRGEGFNLPVLEAAAAGLPVVVTQGGATDDFVLPSFALALPSVEVDLPLDARNRGSEGVMPRWRVPDKGALTAALRRLLQEPGLGAAARQAGPAHVAAKFTWKRVVDVLLHNIRRSMRKPEAGEEGTCDDLS
jgi:glycosyltransferase involved in cell wall biosynthesis